MGAPLDLAYEVLLHLAAHGTPVVMEEGNADAAAVAVEGVVTSLDTVVQVDTRHYQKEVHSSH